MSSSTYQNNFQFHCLVAQQIPKFFCKSPINFGMCASFASFQLGLSFLIHIKTPLLGNMSGSQEAAARCCKCNAAAVMQSKKDVPQTLDPSFLDLVSGSVSILLIGLRPLLYKVPTICRHNSNSYLYLGSVLWHNRMHFASHCPSQNVCLA